MLDTATIKTIQSTIPALKQHGEEITKAFYAIMFREYPQVQSMFDMNKQKNGKQPKALAMAVLNAAMNIDNLENIRSSVESIGKVHVNLHVTKEHYPIVGTCLLQAIKQILQDKATPEIMEAWEKGYQEIANFYIGIEEQLYSAQKVLS